MSTGLSAAAVLLLAAGLAVAAWRAPAFRGALLMALAAVLVVFGLRVTGDRLARSVVADRERRKILDRVKASRKRQISTKEVVERDLKAAAAADAGVHAVAEGEQMELRSEGRRRLES